MSPIRLPVVLSPSRAELAARCHRRHVLHEVVDRRSFNSPSAAFGTVVHKGCSEWLITGNRHKAMDSLITEYKERESSMNEKHPLALAEDMLEVYIREAFIVPLPLTHETEWEILRDDEGKFIERRVELEFEGKVLSFQLDRALTDGGDICIVDIKTTAYLNAKKEAEWARSLQQKLYVVGVRKKFPWARNIYSFIEALHKKATPLFKLVELPQWTEGQLEEALELWKSYAEEDELVIGKGVEIALARHGEKYTKEQLREAVEEVAVTQTSFNYMDCYSYFLSCPYLSICDSSPELRLGILWNDFEIHETEGY